MVDLIIRWIKWKIRILRLCIFIWDKEIDGWDRWMNNVVVRRNWWMILELF